MKRLDRDPIFNSLQVIPWVLTRMYRVKRGLLLVRLSVVIVLFHVTRLASGLSLVMFPEWSPDLGDDVGLLGWVLVFPICEAVGLMDAKARLGLQGTSSLLLLPPPLRPHLHTTLISQAHRCPVRLVIIRGLLMTRELGRGSALVLGEKVKLRGLHYV